jgi:CDP-diacylglycerol--glycerol-3-phosphate 3-phosphatidyltransferase
MNVPNILTSFRIYLSPLFFLSFFFPLWTGFWHLPAIVFLWFLYIVIETSDIVDGSVARALDQVTDMGKLLDPFADVIARLTYFVCFVAVGIMPAWAFILIMYREMGITFLRMLMFRDGYALAAKKGGKLKAVFYAVAGWAGLFIHTCRSLGLFPDYLSNFLFLARVLFAVAAVLALLSFGDYLGVFFRRKKM